MEIEKIEIMDAIQGKAYEGLFPQYALFITTKEGKRYRVNAILTEVPKEDDDEPTKP